MNDSNNTTSKLDSIAAVTTYGVVPSTARYMVNNLFYFPPRFIDILDVYYLQVWNTNTFLNNLQDGMLEVGGTKYNIIYHKTDPCRIKRSKDYTDVKLSFRIADPIFNIPPTVLVKVVEYKNVEDGNNE